MDKIDYFEKLYRRLEPYYDLEEDNQFNGYHIDLSARFYMKNDRYIASKKMVLYSIENNQHIFVKYLPMIEAEDVKAMTDHLNYVAEVWVKPDESHMSTFVRGVLVTDGAISPVAKEQALKYKKEKSFLWGIRGWVYNGINLVDLNDPQNHIHNRRGKEDKFFFEVEKNGKGGL